MASGIVVSRAFGLVRDQVFAFYFGAGHLADAWRAAARIPGVLQSMLGEGTLSASFVPVYVRLLQQGREADAARVARSVLGLLAAVAGALAVAGYLAAPWLVAALMPGFDDFAAGVSVRLLRIFFPMSAVLILSAWTLGILNSHGRFFTAYVAPALWNVAIVATVVALAGRGLLGVDLMVGMGWGALAGGVLQLLFQLPYAVRHLRGAAPGAGRLSPETRSVVSGFVPVVAARGSVNVSGLVENWLASLLGAGAVALLGYATTLYLVPVAVFAHAVAAAELPALSRDRAAGAQAVRERAERAVRTAVAGLAAAAAAFILLGEEVMAAVYAWGGEFGPEEAAAAGWVLAAYGLGLPATGMSRILAGSFHALGDTRTPARIAVAAMVVAALAGVGLMFPFNELRVGGFGLGAAGLALGSALARWLELALLRDRLRRRLSGMSLWTPGTGRLLIGPAAGAATALFASATLPRAHGLVVVAVYAAAWLGISEALGASPLGVRARIAGALERRRDRKR